MARDKTPFAIPNQAKPDKNKRVKNMAVARLSVGVGKKGKAAPHALYIAREENYMKDNDDLEKMEAKAHGNMPKWAQKEPNYFLENVR